MQQDLYFMFQGERVAKEKYITLVASYIHSKAFTQIKPFLRRYYSAANLTNINTQFKDFNLFKKQIQPIFRVANKLTIACRKI